jgi:hypothetical protein
VFVVVLVSMRSLLSFVLLLALVGVVYSHQVSGTIYNASNLYVDAIATLVQFGCWQCDCFTADRRVLMAVLGGWRLVVAGPTH